MNKIQLNLSQNSYILILEIAFEKVCEMASILSRPQCVNQYSPRFLHWHWSNHMIAPVSVMKSWKDMGYFSTCVILCMMITLL